MFSRIFCGAALCPMQSASKIKLLRGFPLSSRVLISNRDISVHEYISYSFLKEADISVPKFGVAKTKEEVVKIANELGTNEIMVKAQVLAGGRGKGKFKGGLEGGVRMANTPEEAADLAGKMIGDYLVTKQTGQEGRICNAVMVTERKRPKKEFYFAFMMERAFEGPVLIASSQGGINIEEVAAKDPKAILYLPIDIMQGIQGEEVVKLVDKVGLQANRVKVTDILLKTYELFLKKDALMVEINPLAEDESGNLFCLDCKMRFDDNAEYRQKELFALRDWTQVDPKEKEANQMGLSYISLNGNIGCLVNGAGLAMATMDIITVHGGSPANFLDVGGGTTAEMVKVALKIINDDPKVRAIFINVFAGINRCDVIAQGVISAVQDLQIKSPLICRIKGNMADEANKLIAASGLKLFSVDGYDEAAKLAVQKASSSG